VSLSCSAKEPRQVFKATSASLFTKGGPTLEETDQKLGKTQSLLWVRVWLPSAGWNGHEPSSSIALLCNKQIQQFSWWAHNPVVYSHHFVASALSVCWFWNPMTTVLRKCFMWLTKGKPELLRKRFITIRPRHLTELGPSLSMAKSTHKEVKLPYGFTLWSHIQQLLLSTYIVCARHCIKELRSKDE
jgi:hypothetical protein